MQGIVSLPDAPSDPQRQLSTLAGHYELRARLGEGGYGEVYEAWDSQLERSVAIKCIKDTAANGLRDAVVREARMAASLQHAAFVKVHAIENDGCGRAIVMELVRGRTLRDVLKDGPVELATALDLVRQVADAMRDAHATALVHGDLKPSNLMVEPSGKLRILDFGLSRKYDTLATQSMPLAHVAGTVAYMAPERLLGKPPDAPGDVYALGVILHELIGGTRPFSDACGLALATAQLQSSSAHWQYPATASPPLVALIRAMTQRQAAKRPRGMDDVWERLSQLAAAPPRTRRRWRDLTRRGARQTAGALALLLCVTAAWHFAPLTMASIPQPVRHSEALDMEQGLAALRLFDRPGALNRAQHCFYQVLDHAPHNAAAVAGIALAHAMRFTGDDQDEVWIQKADAGAQQALRMDEQLALSHVAMGWVLNLQGRREEAIARYERALRLDPNEFFAWYGKANALRGARRFPQALQTLASAMARFPFERVFKDELGSLFDDRGDYAAAETAFRQSIALQPDAVTGYANLTAILQRQKRYDEALGVVQQGLRVRHSARLYGNLGTALFSRGDYVGAAAAFEGAVSPTRGAPGQYLNWVNLADTLLWIPGREREAGRAYDKARKLLAPRLERAPDNAQLLSRMGLYAARAGDGAAAQPLLARAVALGPNDAQAQFRAGLAYELLGNRAAALRAIGLAARLGYPVHFIEKEPDLVALRRDPAFPAD